MPVEPPVMLPVLARLAMLPWLMRSVGPPLRM